MLCLGAVSANDNVTNDYLNDCSAEIHQISDEDVQSIDVGNEDTDFAEIIGQIDDNGLEANDNEISASNGSADLGMDLNAQNCDDSIQIEVDKANVKASSNAEITVKKIPAKIQARNFETYLDSDLFFKVKVINKLDKSPIKKVKIVFRVYSYSKNYKDYTRLTNKNGVATLDKNLKVGSYKVYTFLKDKSYDAEKTRTTLKIKATAETGCCSFYVQVSNSEGVAGFRRDSTYAANLHIKVCKWSGRVAIKQYKLTNTYFFHSITTSDGWMMGTGGADNPSINKAIERIAGKMVKSGKIIKSSLKKIQGYERSLGIGHFAIKAPNGKYVVLWKNGIKTGKLKPGEYLSVPNSAYFFRHGTYTKFNANPVKAALKIGATDLYGVNRRDITVYHWKKTTNKNFKTTSKVTVYAANDNGKMVGRYTPYLKDNIYFKDKYVSKNKLPQTLKMKKLGTHSFGNIDKLIKTPTVVKAPKVTNAFNKTKYFKVSVKNKKTKKAVSAIKIRLKLTSGKFVKIFTVKTDKKGIAKLNTVSLANGTYAVVITPANNKYLISGKSTVVIK